MASLISFSFLLLFIAFTNALPAERIVGGADAKEGQFPFQVSLRHDGEHECGGSIISRNYVLTAAHCVGYTSAGVYYPLPVSLFSLRVGSTDRYSGGLLVYITEIVIHENYGNLLNDLALLKLKEPLIFSKHIQSIPLPSSATPIGSSVIISGWGRLGDAADVPRKLQWTTVTSITRSKCKEEINYDSDALICLAHPVNVGACFGDSGGPAVWNNQLVGVAGFVYTGCGTSYPDGYASVSYHLDWIKKHSDL